MKDVNTKPTITSVLRLVPYMRASLVFSKIRGRAMAHRIKGISVPKSMYDRMQGYSGRTNWSAVARHAFRKELNRLEIEDMIERGQDEIEDFLSVPEFESTL